MTKFHPITNLVIDLEFNNKCYGGYGESRKGKHITHFTYTKKTTKSTKKDIVTIPYDAYQLIDIARNLLFKADCLIRQNCNISDISDLIDNI